MSPGNPNKICVSGITVDYVYNYRTRTFCAECLVQGQRCVFRASTIPELKSAMECTIAQLVPAAL